MGQIILARHAKAIHNRDEEKAAFAGGRVDSPLSKEGIAEATALGKNVAKKFRIDAIVYSSMRRSRQTAEIITKEVANVTDKKVKLIKIENFQEMDGGDFTNRTREEISKIYPRELKIFLDGDIKKWNFPNGEDYQKTKERALTIIEKLMQIAGKYGNIIAVGHGMFNRVILSLIYPDKKELWQPTDYPHDRVIQLKI